MTTVVVKVFDADGVGFDLCECEVGTVRILRVLESHHPGTPREGNFTPSLLTFNSM
jgi:hypothetical protein